jgi:hypothetical protein
MLVENLAAQKVTRYKTYLAQIDGRFAVNELARYVQFLRIRTIPKM